MGAFILWSFGFLPVAQSVPNASATPSFGTRICLEWSPYYFPITSSAPNPGMAVVEREKKLPGNGQSSVTSEDVKTWEADLAWLARTLRGKARLIIVHAREDRESTCVVGAQEAAWDRDTAKLKAAPGTSRRNASTGGKVVVVQFPADTPLAVAVEEVHAALQQLQYWHWENIYAAGERLTQLLREKAQVSKRWADSLDEQAVRLRETRQSLWAQLGTFNGEPIPSGLPAESNGERRDLDQALARHQALLEKRQKLLATRTSEHPEVKQVEAELAELEALLRLRSREFFPRNNSGPSSLQFHSDWITLPDKQPVGSSPSAGDPRLGSTWPLSREPYGSPTSLLVQSFRQVEELEEATQQLNRECSLQLAALETASTFAVQEWRNLVQRCASASGWRIIIPPQPVHAGVDTRDPHSFTSASPKWWHWIAVFAASFLTAEVVYFFLARARGNSVIRSKEHLRALADAPVFVVRLPGRLTDIRRRTDPAHTVHDGTPHLGVSDASRLRSKSD